MAWLQKKLQYKKYKIIIFDISKVSTVLSCYPINTFPQQKIFSCQDFLKCGPEILDKDFDFLIMLGWTAKILLKNRMVDALIDVKSMIETSSTIIKDYILGEYILP